MNETEKYLLDAAIDLAVTKEFDEFTKLDAGDTELPAALDKRVRSTLRRKKFTIELIRAVSGIDRDLTHGDDLHAIVRSETQAHRITFKHNTFEGGTVIL